MAGRQPSTPPVLEGLRYVRVLGVGGYSDVYLYTEETFGRDVAVKVLLSPAEGVDGRRRFLNEARAMAALSTHPAIVTVYGAEIARDGRPYLVMEYYARDDLWVQCRASPLPAASALRIGVQIAGAVETAHRAGILHRDIKPANILVNEYGRPGLTDFGIASTHETAAGEDDGGLSVPWSPPEAFARPTDDVRSDVYSLAATVYSLIAGHSPFEYGGTRPSTSVLMRRIELDPLPVLERGGHPPSLQRLLETAMAKHVEDRMDSAAAFARGLQAVEGEMQLPMTDLDVPEASAARGRPLPTGSQVASEDTRLRAASIGIQPSPPARAPTPPSPAAPAPELHAAGAEAPAPVDETVSARAVRRPLPPLATPAAPPDELTRQRPDAAAWASQVSEQTAPPAGTPPHRRRVLVVAGLALAVLAAGGATLLWQARQPTASTPAVDSDVSPQSPAEVVGLPTPTDVKITAAVGGAEVTWVLPETQPGDLFRINRTDVSGVKPVESDGSPETITVQPGERACVVVTLVRDRLSSAQSAQDCLDAPAALGLAAATVTAALPSIPVEPSPSPPAAKATARTWPPYPGEASLGDSGEVVLIWQDVLVRAGAIRDTPANHDGYYGPGMEAAVLRLQKDWGWTDADGVAGPHTYTRLTGVDAE